MRPHRADDSGFTMTELMVVVVIIGIMSAVATPYFGRDRIAREGREFASELARDMSRARQQAVSERLPIRVFVYADRIEFRSFLAAAKVGANASLPAFSDPTLRVIYAKPGVFIMNVQASSAAPPPGAASVLPTAGDSSIHLQLDITGQMLFEGQAAMAPAFIYVRNTNLPANHQDRQLRIDVTALTGHVDYRDRWI